MIKAAFRENHLCDCLSSDAASCHRGCQSAPHGSQTPPHIQLEEFRGDQEDPQHGSKDRSGLLASGSGVTGHQRSEEGVQEAAPTPQFCSKHQRWVESILQQCSDECSEELLLQANASPSPLLFHSSSSTSSSQDFTPSDLVPPDRPPSQTPGSPQAAARASGPGGSPRSSCAGSHRNPLPEASCSGPALLVPLGDICSPNPPRASAAEMLSSPHSGNSVNAEETLAATTNSSPARGLPSSSTSSEEVPQSSTRCRRRPGKQRRPQSEATSTHWSSASRRSRTCRARGAELKLSVPSQALLLRSWLFQPRVSLTRLSSQQCDSAGQPEPEEPGSSSEEEEEDTQASFDVNTLYTTSSSDGGQSPDRDPDYRPHISKKALLLEYEAARLLGGDVHSSSEAAPPF